MPKYLPTDDPVEVLDHVDKVLDDLYGEVHEGFPDVYVVRCHVALLYAALESYVPSERPPKAKTGKDLAEHNDYVRRANARIHAARAAKKKDNALAGIYVKDWND